MMNGGAHTNKSKSGDPYEIKNKLDKDFLKKREMSCRGGIGLGLNGLAAIEAVEGRPRKEVEIAAAAQFFAEQEGVAIEFGEN